MRRLKIVKDDVPLACGDVFGTNDLQDRMKSFCREQGLEMPHFWVFPPDGVLICHAVSLHLTGKDRWEEFDAHAVFVLKDFSTQENREMEANRLQCMFEDLGEPVVLTAKIAERPFSQQRFYKSIGLVRTSVTWSDYHQNDYEAYVKGKFEMGGFVNLMEHVEYIGKEIVYTEDNGK